MADYIIIGATLTLLAKVGHVTRYSLRRNGNPNWANDEAAARAKGRRAPPAAVAKGQEDAVTYFLARMGSTGQPSSQLQRETERSVDGKYYTHVKRLR